MALKKRTVVKRKISGRGAPPKQLNKKWQYVSPTTYARLLQDKAKWKSIYQKPVDLEREIKNLARSKQDRKRRAELATKLKEAKAVRAATLKRMWDDYDCCSADLARSIVVQNCASPSSSSSSSSSSS